MVASNINEIIGTDPQVQLPAYIQLEGMDQVRSNRKLHVMVIVKVVPVVTNPPEGEAIRESFLAGLAVPGFNSEFVSILQ